MAILFGLRQRSACRHAHQNFVEKGRKICVFAEKGALLRVWGSLGVRSGTREAKRS